MEQQLFPYLPFIIEKEFLPHPYLMEFDDSIYITHPQKLPQVIGAAAGVIAGNRHLADYAEQFNPNVHVVPTVLNTNTFAPAEKKNRDKLILGWSGIEYNFKYISRLAPVFNRLLARYPIEIVILSATAPKDFSFAFTHWKWDGATEVKQMNEFDVGLMPLELDEWCKGKCGLKLLQYMSLKLPSIATPAGVNAEIIRDGSNGFCASDLEEWETKLIRLIEDSELRQRMGAAARSTVLEGYSTNVWFPRLLEIYRRYAR